MKSISSVFNLWYMRTDDRQTSIIVAVVLVEVLALLGWLISNFP